MKRFARNELDSTFLKVRCRWPLAGVWLLSLLAQRPKAKEKAPAPQFHQSSRRQVSEAVLNFTLEGAFVRCDVQLMQSLLHRNAH